MIVHIASRGSVDLLEPNDFKKFKISVAAPRGDFDQLKSKVSGPVRLETAEHGWVGIEGLKRWKGLSDDKAYQDGLAGMIKVAEKYNWLDADKTSIRAHIEWADTSKA